MIILGIDPGLHYCGYSILKKEQSKVILLSCGFLTLSPKETLAQRLSNINVFFDQQIKKYNITDLSLETPFLGKNAQNFLKLGYVRGILYLLANNYNLKINEFTPRQIKLAITGFGGAGKDQVARVILQLFPSIKKPEREDVTDALAVTLCCLWKNNSSLFSIR